MCNCFFISAITCFIDLFAGTETFCGEFELTFETNMSGMCVAIINKLQETNIDVDEQPARAFVFDPGIELQTLVDALNETGTTATDMVAILEALREAGALRAELIVI